MWSIVQAAGWPIWPLIVASVIALALIFERLWSLRQSVVAPAGMVDRVLAEYRKDGATPALLDRQVGEALGRIPAVTGDGAGSVSLAVGPRLSRAAQNALTGL